MVSDIILMDVRFWENLELSTLQDHPTNNHGSNPIPRKVFQKKQENHTIIENMVDELHMVESKK